MDWTGRCLSLCPPLEVLGMETGPSETFCAFNLWNIRRVSISSSEDNLVGCCNLLFAIPRYRNLPLLVVGSSDDSVNAGIEPYVLMQAKVGSIGENAVNSFIRIHMYRNV
jgi:hypothetical protein